MSADESRMIGRSVPGKRSVEELMREIGVAARAAAQFLGVASTELKNRALLAAAAALRAHRDRILDANERDLAEAVASATAGPNSGTGGNPSAALLDRLRLDDQRVLAMAASLEEIARLADPIGTVLAEWTRPNGLRIERRRVPLGVVG